MNYKILDLMQSEIRNMSIECDRVGGINLSQGICDLPLPDILKTGIMDAIDLGYNQYTRYDGIQYLREEIAKKALKFNKIKADPNENVVVSCGATGALYCACSALFNDGDEVILFEPFYGYHEYTLKSLNLSPIYVRMSLVNWEIDYNYVESIITNKTRAVLISTPSNPSGKIFSEEELKLLGDICEKHNLLLLSDEIYEYITYDGRKHISPASISRIKDRVITISGYSKTFNITGWRLGYAIANEQISTMIGYVNDLLYVCAPSPIQYAVAKGIHEIEDSYYSNVCAGYEEKRDMLCRTLNNCKLPVYIPAGAYYAMADVSRLPGENSKEKAMYLLNETKIATVPGKAFYHDSYGENLVRFCFAKNIEVIQQACEILEKNKHKW